MALTGAEGHLSCIKCSLTQFFARRLLESTVVRPLNLNAYDMVGGPCRVDEEHNQG